MSTIILWKNVLEAQGYDTLKNILYQDNKSTTLLEENENKIYSKRNREINIRYLFMTYQIGGGELNVQYWPTIEMIAGFMSNMVQGEIFKKIVNVLWSIELWPIKCDNRSVLDGSLQEKSTNTREILYIENVYYKNYKTQRTYN